MSQVRCAVMCPPVIQWLLSVERDVFVKVQEFAQETGPDSITVAGPPEDLERLQAIKKGRPVQLPTVQLFMKRGKHSQTKAPFIEIACAETDLVELSRWQLRRRRSAH